MSKRFFGKSLVLFTFMVALLASTFVATAQQSSVQAKSAQVNATSCRNFDESRLGVIPVYISRINGAVCSNGSRVWITRVDCSYIRFGADINQTYCGVIRNDGSTAEVGSNWGVALIYNGSPIGYPGHMRVQFDRNGNTSTVSGSG